MTELDRRIQAEDDMAKYFIDRNGDGLFANLIRNHIARADALRDYRLYLKENEDE